jgi:hypothetical protein
MKIFKDNECTRYESRCVLINGKQYGFAHAIENDVFDPDKDWSIYSTNTYDLSEDKWEQIE